jgi:hypothetical protein
VGDAVPLREGEAPDEDEADTVAHRDAEGEPDGDPVSEKERLLVGETVDVRHRVGDADCVGDTEPLREGEAHDEGEADTVAHRDAEGEPDGDVVSE